MEGWEKRRGAVGGGSLGGDSLTLGSEDGSTAAGGESLTGWGEEGSTLGGGRGWVKTSFK